MTSRTLNTAARQAFTTLNESTSDNPYQSNRISAFLTHDITQKAQDTQAWLKTQGVDVDARLLQISFYSDIMSHAQQEVDALVEQALQAGYSQRLLAALTGQSPSTFNRGQRAHEGK